MECRKELIGECQIKKHQGGLEIEKAQQRKCPE